MNKYNDLNIIASINKYNEINFASNNSIDNSVSNYQKYKILIKSRNQNHKNIMGKPKIDLSQFINSYKSGNFKGYNNNNIKSKSVDEKQINYYNSITKKYSKSLNFIYNSHIEAINTQFINYRRFINKKKYTYESFINNSYYLNDFKNAKKRNFSAQNIRAKNIKEKQLIKFEKVLAILKKKIYSYKQLFFKKILYYIKRNDILPNVNKYCEYEICHENDIYFSNEINTNRIKKINSLIKEKKEYEDKIIVLINENNALKDSLVKWEDNYYKIKKEKESINKINRGLIKKYNNLSKELEDLKIIKDKYKKILKEKNLSSLNINQKIELISNKITKINDKIKDINDNYKKKESEERNTDNNPVNKDDNIQPKFISRENRERYLKNIFQKKIDKIKQYIQKNFSKFYYNGIFLQMTGKLIHLEEKKKNSGGNIVFDDKKNENTISKNDLIKEEEEKKLKERMKRSRSLRRLLNRKAKEKKELLKNNFFKFYRNGIISKFRKEKKRKTVQVDSALSCRLAQKLIEKQGIKLGAKEEKEKEDLKQKIVSILKKIIYRADRRNMIVMKNVFQRFYLKTKLESVKNIIENDDNRKKKKKKKKKKSKKKDDNKSLQKDNNNES